MIMWTIFDLQNFTAQLLFILEGGGGLTSLSSKFFKAFLGQRLLEYEKITLTSEAN